MTPRKVAAHGTRAAYTGGCRCEPCRDSNRRYQAEWRRSNPESRRRTRQRARDAGKRWPLSPSELRKLEGAS